MIVSRLFIAITFSITLICSATAHAETAKQAYARGNTLLTEGNIEEALQAYSKAVRGQRSNQKYRQQAMLVRRMVALRKNLTKEKETGAG